jgi:Niemann-Pick C1 protein
MNISADGSVPYKDNKVSITSVDIYVSEEYAYRLYNSCKNVQYSQFSTKVIDLMCGTTECSPKKWLNFLGDPVANGESPFAMNYYITSNDSSLHGGLVAKTYDYMECNTTDLNYQCSCSDCNAPNVCPFPPQASPNTFPYFEITIIVVSVGAGLSVFIFIVALIAAIVSLIRKSGYTRIGGSSGIIRKSRDHYGAIEDDDNDLQSSSVSSINADAGEVPANQTDRVDVPPPHRSITRCWFQLGSWIEYAIKNAFYHWGKFVAQYWYIVFFFVGIIALALSFGLFFFKVTTNPVDLWSSPTSRAREEKAYFDKNFNPFYRTEMIIVTAPDYNYSTYTPFGAVTGWKFGPVFDPEVLDEVHIL